MPLIPTALFTDVDQVWDMLCVAEDERLVKNEVMEQWINMASAFMEQLLNRPGIVRDVHEEVDGHGLPTIYVRQTPMVSLTALRVYDSDFQGFEDINVQQDNNQFKQIELDLPRGRLVILPDAPISRFTRGAGNVVIDYRAGWANPGDLAVIQQAAVEMIAVVYNELGRNPREQTRSDAITTVSAFTKGDFDELPWMMKQCVMHYRKRSF